MALRSFPCRFTKTYGMRRYIPLILRVNQPLLFVASLLLTAMFLMGCQNKVNPVDVSYIIGDDISGEIRLCPGDEGISYQKDSRGVYTLLINQPGEIRVTNLSVAQSFRVIDVVELSSGAPLQVYLVPPKEESWNDDFEKGIVFIGTDERGCNILFVGNKEQAAEYLTRRRYW